MTMNLIHTNRSAPRKGAQNWAALTAIADHATVFIDEDIVDSIARLLREQPLANGEIVSSYPRDEDADEFSMPSYVSDFAPSLLPTQVQDQVRDRLARGETGKAAVRLFNEVIRLELQLSLNGKEHCGAYVKAVNWSADDVAINRCAGNMLFMLRDLGLGEHCNPDKGPEAVAGEVEFETFAKAVEDRGERTDMAERLTAFVACARRHAATHVHWA